MTPSLGTTLSRQRFVLIWIFPKSKNSSSKGGISIEGYRVPETDADLFRILIENKIIDQSQSGPLDKMAKFGNIVVHQYEKVDPSIVIGILGNL